MVVSKINKNNLLLVTISVMLLSLVVVFISKQENAYADSDTTENLITRYENIDKTYEGLETYREKIINLQKSVKNSGVYSFFSTITFSEPLSIEKIKDIIEDNKINTKLIYILAKDKNGELITIGLRPKTKNDENIFNGFETRLIENNISIVGVEAIIGYVKNSKISILQTLDEVFLVDISADNNLTDNPNNKDYIHHFGWDLYHLK